MCMKLRSLFSSLLVFIFSIPAFSQSAYYFKYNFHTAGDSINYHAFFLRYEDGTALARVRYENPVNKEDVLIEMDMEEKYVFDRSGLQDTTRLLYKSTAQRIISDDKVVFDKDLVFLFKNDPNTGFIEPAGVIAHYSDIVEMSPSTSFSSELKEKANLNEAFISKFFEPDEDFYANFFRSGTKDLTPEEKGFKMYLLVVANVRDPDIGKSCEKDMGRMVESFNGIGSKLGLAKENIIVRTISGDEYTKKNIDAAINAIKPVKNKDIVIFYYTGHGFRKAANKKSQFPFIDLRSKNDSNYNTQSLNMEDIFNRIKAKGARFNLVLGDCCNTYVGAYNATGTKIGKGKGSGFLLSQDNCKSLFMDKMPISILACAADSNQRATGSNDFGGFFSYFLKTSLENYCSIFKKDVSWKQILDDTYKQTIYKAEHTYCDKPYIPQNICSQRPIYKSVPATLLK